MAELRISIDFTGIKNLIRRAEENLYLNINDDEALDTELNMLGIEQHDENEDQ